jgi:hypothetical protein
MDVTCELLEVGLSVITTGVSKTKFSMEIVHKVSTYVITVFTSKILKTLQQPSTFRFFPTKLKC